MKFVQNIYRSFTMILINKGVGIVKINPTEYYIKNDIGEYEPIHFVTDANLVNVFDMHNYYNSMNAEDILQEIGSKLDEIVRLPKIKSTNIIAKNGLSNSTGYTVPNGYFSFSAVYHAYDMRRKTAGNMYAVELSSDGRTGQNIFYSLDGGKHWEILGEVPNITTKQITKQIYVDEIDGVIYLLRTSDYTVTPNINVVESYAFDITNKTMTFIGALNIGTADWHSSMHNCDTLYDNVHGKSITMFAEYTTYSGQVDCKVYRTNDKGATWATVMTKGSR